MTRIEAIRHVRALGTISSDHVGSLLSPSNGASYRHTFTVFVYIVKGVLKMEFTGNCTRRSDIVNITALQLLSYIQRNFPRAERL